MIVKRSIQRGAGWAAVVLDSCWGGRAVGQAGILMYHRVANIGFVDRVVDDWNVSPRRFERQVTALAAFAEVVPLTELQSRLLHASHGDKPIVSLTFDDGYANFYTQALPILRRYNLPSTVFVVTSAVGSSAPMPFDGWSLKNGSRMPADVCRSMNWHEIESCLATSLVQVGSHSHRHLKASECTAERLIQEAHESREILHRRLGDNHGNVYAYPYGTTQPQFVPPEYVGAVRSAGYQLAVCSDLGLVDCHTDQFLLPRIEAHQSDTPSVLRAKTRGALGPYYFLGGLRSARHAIGQS